MILNPLSTLPRNLKIRSVISWIYVLIGLFICIIAFGQYISQSQINWLLLFSGFSLIGVFLATGSTLPPIVSEKIKVKRVSHFGEAKIVFDRKVANICYFQHQTMGMIVIAPQRIASLLSTFPEFNSKCTQSTTSGNMYWETNLTEDQIYGILTQKCFAQIVE